LAVDLPVAIGVKQRQIGDRLLAAISAPEKMVDVPTRFFGDLLGANRTDSFLAKPEAKQLPSFLQVVEHFQTQPAFEVSWSSKSLWHNTGL
jgi:hypothetical protein